MHTRPRMLVVDDDEEIRRFIRTLGVRLGFDVMDLGNPAEFEKTVREFLPTLITLDLQMPGADGVTLLRQLSTAQSKAKIILVSGCDERVLQTVQELARAQGLTTAGVLRKPITDVALEKLIRDADLSPAEVQDKDLRDALANGEITVHYQPQISRQSGRWVIDSAEALVRWQHPIFGMVKPSAFIPVAEASGLIATMTDFVFRKVVEQIQAWKKNGSNIEVAVNLSPLLLNDLELPDRLQALLGNHGLTGPSLTVEITESSAIADPTMGMDILSRLRVMGVGLSIDDFGTGNSSLRQLYRMPFNELKIDGSFVRGVTDSDEAKAIVRATVDLAHALKMTTCAEWVESREILTYLEGIGCDKAQGHLISAAVPAAQFMELVGRWNSQPPERRTRSVLRGPKAG